MTHIIKITTKNDNQYDFQQSIQVKPQGKSSYLYNKQLFQIILKLFPQIYTSLQQRAIEQSALVIATKVLALFRNHTICNSL